MKKNVNNNAQGKQIKSKLNLYNQNNDMEKFTLTTIRELAFTPENKTYLNQLVDLNNDESMATFVSNSDKSDDLNTFIIGKHNLYVYWFYKETIEIIPLYKINYVFGNIIKNEMSLSVNYNSYNNEETAKIYFANIKSLLFVHAFIQNIVLINESYGQHSRNGGSYHEIAIENFFYEAKPENSKYIGNVLR